MHNFKVFKIFYISTVLALCVAQSGFAALPNTVPGDGLVATAIGDQIAPAIAQGENMSLAVWSDNRANVTANFEGETSADIYGMRLSSSGEFLDTVPLAIAALPSAQENPKVAWNGANWLVVFESYDISGTGFFYTKSIQAVRVSPNGTVLDQQPINFPGIPSGSWNLTANGSGWTLTAKRSSISSDIVAMRVSADGVLLDAPIHTLVDSAVYQASNFHLAYADGVHLLTLDKYVSLGTYVTLGVRFDDNLNLLDATPLELVDSSATGLAANGNGFYLVWNEFQPNLSTLLLGSRLDTSANFLDPEGKLVAGSKSIVNSSVTAMWDGVNWRLTFEFSGNLWTTRVTDSGLVLDPEGLAVPGPQSGSVAGNGSGGFQIVWSDFAENNYDTYQSAIDASNTASSNNILSIGAPQQLRSDTAMGDEGIMLVYRSITADLTRVLAQPLSLTGQPMTAEPIELASGTVFNGPGSPAVSWNGSVYMIVWATSDGVMAQRLQQDGTMLDSTPITAMANSFGRADVAALGDDFLVTGRMFGSSIEFVLPVAARVSGSGNVLDVVPQILGAYYAGTPAVTTLGERWLVVWHRNVTHDDSSAETMGTFITADGTFEPAYQIHSFFSTTGGNSIFEVGLASNGTIAVMVQSQELSSGVETDLLVHTIDTTGTVSEMVNLTPWSGNQYSPRVTWDGKHFIVVYQDQKLRSAVLSLDQLDARSDLFGMRLDVTGNPIDPQGFVIAAESIGESHPNIAVGNDTALFSASVMANDSVNSNYRIFYDLRDLSNQWPVAVAASTYNAEDFPINVDFSSVGSTDPDGVVVDYLWDFGDGSTSSAPNPSHTYTSAGAFVTELTVTDDQGASTKQLVSVPVSAPNELPIAVGAADPPSGPAPLAVIFNANGSYDPDGSLGNVHWIFSDGGEYWGSPAFHTYVSEGTHSALLEVFDSRGAIGTTAVIVEVEQTTNESPTAAFTFDCSGLTCTYTDASTDPDGTITKWDWEFGDGFVEFVPNPLPHTYSQPGTYNVSLTVRDDIGATDTLTIPVTVTDTAPSPGLHIGDLDGTGSAIIRRLWTATVSITVHDELERSVAGARVVGTWGASGQRKVTCVTDTNGRCSISNSRIRRSSSSITFSIVTVRLRPLTYDTDANHDPEADSDGTSIVINQLVSKELK